MGLTIRIHGECVIPSTVHALKDVTFNYRVRAFFEQPSANFTACGQEDKYRRRALHIVSRWQTIWQRAEKSILWSIIKLSIYSISFFNLHVGSMTNVSVHSPLSQL